MIALIEALKGRKVGGMRVWRFGRLTFMACIRTKTDGQRDNERLRKRAKLMRRKHLESIGRRYMRWGYPAVASQSAYEPDGVPYSYGVTEEEHRAYS